MTLTIRTARFPQDRAVALSFIDGLQAFEHQFEPNRRLDPAVAAEYFLKLHDDVTKQPGEVFIAADNSRAIGWAVVHELEDDIYVVEAERRVAYISELYLTDAARGLGVGGKLIAACEEWARTHGYPIALIGVLAGNNHAEAVYRHAGYGSYSMMLRKYL